jgi:hypothetical protein
MASDRMVANLLGLATDAESEVVRLRATDSALDRAGINKPTQVEVGTITPFEMMFEDISCERPGSFGSVDDSGFAIDHEDYEGISTNPNRPGGERVRAEQPVADGDYDRPRGPQTREQRGPDRNYRDGYHVTGDDAIRMANAANAEIGALRALPPGRSGR